MVFSSSDHELGNLVGISRQIFEIDKLKLEEGNDWRHIGITVKNASITLE